MLIAPPPPLPAHGQVTSLGLPQPLTPNLPHEKGDLNLQQNLTFLVHQWSDWGDIDLDTEKAVAEIIKSIKKTTPSPSPTVEKTDKPKRAKCARKLSSTSVTGPTLSSNLSQATPSLATYSL